MRGPRLFAAAALLGSVLHAGLASAAEEAADSGDRAEEEQTADGEPSPDLERAIG